MSPPRKLSKAERHILDGLKEGPRSIRSFTHQRPGELSRFTDTSIQEAAKSLVRSRFVMVKDETLRITEAGKAAAIPPYVEPVSRWPSEPYQQGPMWMHCPRNVGNPPPSLGPFSGASA